MKPRGSHKSAIIQETETGKIIQQDYQECQIYEGKRVLYFKQKADRNLHMICTSDRITLGNIQASMHVLLAVSQSSLRHCKKHMWEQQNIPC